jgi:hypothetical protein
MVQVITRQLLYQFSNNCLAFQAEFGLFLWSTGCARQTIDALDFPAQIPVKTGFIGYEWPNIRDTPGS